MQNFFLGSKPTESDTQKQNIKRTNINPGEDFDLG